jgi:hypothetical protein
MAEKPQTLKRILRSAHIDDPTAAVQFERAIASFFLEQHSAASSDGLLHCLRKFVQQPGQRHFQLHVILGDLNVSCCYLSEGADAETQPVAQPSLLLNGEHWKLEETLPNAGFHAPQGLFLT